MRRRHGNQNGARQIGPREMVAPGDTVVLRQQAAPTVALKPGQVICPICFRVTGIRPKSGTIRNHNYCMGAGLPAPSEETT